MDGYLSPQRLPRKTDGEEMRWEASYYASAVPMWMRFSRMTLSILVELTHELVCALALNSPAQCEVNP